MDKARVMLIFSVFGMEELALARKECPAYLNTCISYIVKHILNHNLLFPLAVENKNIWSNLSCHQENFKYDSFASN